MNDKKQVLSALEDEINRWEELFCRLSDRQIEVSQLPFTYSVKDVVAHLMAWQQVSNARMEAAQTNTEPGYPDWLEGQDPEAEENIDEYNARIYEKYKDHPWSQVHKKWREGFIRLIELGTKIPENDLTNTKLFPWLKGNALIAVLRGTLGHHHEDHLEPLLDRFEK